MNGVIATEVALLLVVVVTAAFRLTRWLRAPDDPAARAVFLALVCFGVAVSLGLPTVYDAAFQVLRQTPALPQLIQHAATMATAFYGQVFALAIGGGGRRDDEHRPVRRRRCWLLAALLALVVSYLLGPWRLGLHDLGHSGIADPDVALYIGVTQLYAAVTLTDIARITWAHRRGERPYLRIGLRLASIGSGFGVLFSVHKTLYYAVAAFGARLPWNESGANGIQLFFLAPAVLGLSSGMLIPFWGPRIAQWRRRRAAFRQLGPLAAALRTVAPEAATLDLSPLRGVQTRLLNRVITIRDTLIGPLRIWFDAVQYDLAYERAVRDGQPPEQARILAEAAYLAAAIHDARTGAPGRVADPAPRLMLGPDLDAEATWLARVSAAYVDLVGRGAAVPGSGARGPR